MDQRVNLKQIARTLHDANRSLRQGIIEARLLMVAVGVLAAMSFPFWIAVLVDIGVALVTIAVAEVMATRWMRRNGLEQP